MKKQASFKEYTVTIADSGSVEVYKAFKNALEGLKEVAESINLSYPPSWFAQKLGTLILKELNGGDTEATSAITGNYIISREPNNSLKVSKLYGNTVAALRELSEIVGFEEDEKWNTRTFGNKVIDAIESGEFKKLAKLKKVEDTMEIEMDEETTTEEVATPQAFEIPDTSSLDFPCRWDDEDLDSKKVIAEQPHKRCRDNIGYTLSKDRTKFYNFTHRDEYDDDCWENGLDIPEGVVTICDSAFGDSFFCFSGLVKLPDSVRYVGNYALCCGTELELNEGLEYLGDYALGESCMEEKNSTLIGGLPSTLKHIGDKAFHNCEFDDTDVIIPEGILHIGKDAFESSNITSITIPERFKDIIDSLGLPKGCEVTFI